MVDRNNFVMQRFLHRRRKHQGYDDFPVGVLYREFDRGINHRFQKTTLPIG
jgi:hypothetical protein